MAGLKAALSALKDIATKDYDLEGAKAHAAGSALGISTALGVTIDD